MMSDSSKPRDSGANRSGKADKLCPESEGSVTGDDESYCGKRRRGFTDEKTNDCIGSQAPELSQPTSSSEIGGSPAETLVADSGATEVGQLKSLASFSHGSVSVTGRRRVMEDALTVVPGIVAGEFSFFAVYDGHGGSRVSNACRDRLHQLMMNELKNSKSPDEPTHVGGCGGEGVGIEWEKVMRGCFAKMDEEVNERSRCVADVDRVLVSGNNMVGSTAAVVMVGKEVVVVANCGDSRVVLGRGGVAVPLSRDHKPDRPDELERVEAIGGKVINWNGNRVLGVLATSRSIGDHDLKPYVISEPEITVSKRTELDDFLIIASDGLWDVVSNEVACNVVRKCVDNQKRKKSRSQKQGSAAAEAATMLAGLAMGKGSKDNISIIVIELKNSN